MDLESLVRPLVEADGLEFVEVGFVTEQGRRILRVTVDQDGGLDLDTIAALSSKLSRRLDLEGVASSGYVLEVTSPGLERPLKEPRDFQRTLGERVKVKIAVPAPETFRGRLAEADEEHIVVTTEDGQREVAYADIITAKTVFEWGDA